MSDTPFLRTKLNPPRLSRHALVRPRVDARLSEALEHRVTIIQASTGYGKSTALASLAETQANLFWYSASEQDADPQQFLAHVIGAFRLRLAQVPDTPLALLQDTYAGGVRPATDALLNALDVHIDQPSLLVIDDYHLAASNEVNAALDHFLLFLPADLHVIVSTRNPPSWEHLVSWRARGEIMDVKHDTLAFVRDEIATLFQDKYGYALAPHEIELLQERTEGWPIALQLVWQELRTRPQTDIAALFGHGSDSLDTLFAYLAQNVLAQQPAPLQDLLLRTSVLRELSTPACQAVAGNVDCGAMLAFLLERDLFIASLGEGQYRYHHLFHDFLREQATRQDANGVRERHCRAAEFYRRAGNFDEAIYHLLRAGAFDEMAQLIEEIGENTLRAGRLDTLAGWMDAIPPELVGAHPLLMSYLGDLARLRSRFDDALAWYAQAERAWRTANDIGGIARALRGQALVYLDTVRPARAASLLEESLRLSDGLDDRVARARVLELLAENKLNMGKAEEAEQLRLRARTLREEGPSEDVLGVRVKLRTGRLDEAREILETWAHQERGQLHPPRAHRETLLILSLVHAMQGHGEESFAAAREALTLASQLHSPFVSAVGQMRLGHALQVRGDFRAALRSYEEAVKLGDQVAVRRTRAEACWGMARAQGLVGDLEAARHAAAEGIETGRSAGDLWIVALVQIGLGASLVHAKREREATAVLADALAAFRSCGDTFGAAAARLWLSVAHWRLEQRERAMAHLDEGLALAQTHHYDYLLTERTLLGWHDARVVIPLMIAARQKGMHVSYIARLLAAKGLDGVTLHPGYQLRVQTLGAFRVWRGEEEIAAREWQRRKARELFQLLITFRGGRLQREEIFELLWRDEPPETAARDFKVALNALTRVLEPRRSVNETSAYVAREESAYGLRPGADLWVDADEFARLIREADATTDLEQYRQALELYQDDYMLNEVRYTDWASAERERLLAIYLHAADRLASELLERQGYDECIMWCERILARERCWEHAYRLTMQAAVLSGDRARAHRVFQRCMQVLREDLDVEPSPATVETYRRLVERDPKT